MQVGLFIDGEETASAVHETFMTVDPATEEGIASVARASPADVDSAVDAAERCLTGPWRRTTPRRRVELLAALALAVEREQADLARLKRLDSGKPTVAGPARDGVHRPILPVLRRRGRQDPR